MVIHICKLISNTFDRIRFPFFFHKMSWNKPRCSDDCGMQAETLSMEASNLLVPFSGSPITSGWMEKACSMQYTSAKLLTAHGQSRTITATCNLKHLGLRKNVRNHAFSLPPCSSPLFLTQYGACCYYYIAFLL